MEFDFLKSEGWICSELFCKSCSLCLFQKNVFWQKQFFFGKVVDLQDSNLLKWNPTLNIFLGITEIIFCNIFPSSDYIESLQIIDKICSSYSYYLIVFFHYLTSIAQYSNILFSRFFRPSCYCSSYILKFWLF